MTIPKFEGYSYADLARAMAVSYADRKPSAKNPSQLLEKMRKSVGLHDMPPGTELVERLFVDALGFDDAKWLEHDPDTRGVAATRGGDFVWCDQGTTNFRGWISNTKRKRVPWKDLGRDIPGKVHHGFGGSALDQFDEIRGRSAGADRLLLIGHSRGGAHVTCYTALFLELGLPVDLLFTAGKPRVGNRAFSRWLSSHEGVGLGVRGVRNNDIVTRFPALGYRHENGASDDTPGFFLLWIEADGSISVDPGQWAQFRDRLVGRIEMLLEGGGEPTIEEVPSLTAADVRKLGRRGYRSLRAVLEAGTVALSEIVGFGPGSAIMEWAKSRAATLDVAAGVFDGLYDHSIDRYAHDLEVAGV